MYIVDYKVIKMAPIKNYRTGTMEVALWENEIEDKTFRNITISRSYKDKEDNWKNTNNIPVDDIPKLVAILNEVYRSQMFENKEN